MDVPEGRNPKSSHRHPLGPSRRLLSTASIAAVALALGSMPSSSRPDDQVASGPQAHLITPNGGERLGIGSTIAVRWTAYDSVGIAGVDLYLSRNGVLGPFDPISAAEPNDGVYSWTVTGPPTVQGLFLVAAHGNEGGSAADISDASFEISSSLAEAGAVPPAEFALGPVTPNPARAHALVAYALPRDAVVRLTVHDIQGREVAVLAEGPRAAGRYAATWSPGPGGKARPGVYFVRYRAAGSDLVRRFVLAR